MQRLLAPSVIFHKPSPCLHVKWSHSFDTIALRAPPTEHVLCSAIVMVVVPAKWAFSKCGLLKAGFKATTLSQFTLPCDELIVNLQHAHKRPIIGSLSLQPQSNTNPTPDT